MVVDSMQKQPPIRKPQQCWTRVIFSWGFTFIEVFNAYSEGSHDFNVQHKGFRRSKRSFLILLVIKTLVSLVSFAWVATADWFKFTRSYLLSYNLAFRLKGVI
jgi:hypothetical protein